MISLKFNGNTKDRVYKSPEWISNGHWMIDTRLAGFMSVSRSQKFKSTSLQKELSRVCALADGRHDKGIHDGQSKLPDFKALLPSAEKLKVARDITPIPVGAIVDEKSMGVTAYVFRVPGSTPEEDYGIHVAPEYVPLMMNFHAIKATDKDSAILLLDEQNEVRGLLMPIRQKESSKHA